MLNISTPGTLHREQPIRWAGTPLAEATSALVMLHGRGASAESILTLADELDVPKGFALAAPQAAGHTWYPYSFLAPRERNEPWLSSALDTVEGLIDQLDAAGIPSERIVLLGFSQGACLALDAATRQARRYGGVIALSGGLIGERLNAGRYAGDFAGTPVFLGCSDIDAHIPEARVHASADLVERLGADVTTRIYPGMGHTINRDELAFVDDLLAALSTRTS